MNIKPYYQQVIACIGESQDGHTLSHKDQYGKFILSLIADNTESNPLALDAGEVDTEELESNIRYAIHELNKALYAVKKFNFK